MDSSDPIVDHVTCESTSNKKSTSDNPNPQDDIMKHFKFPPAPASYKPMDSTNPWVTAGRELFGKDKPTLQSKPLSVVLEGTKCAIDIQELYDVELCLTTSDISTVIMTTDMHVAYRKQITVKKNKRFPNRHCVTINPDAGDILTGVYLLNSARRVCIQADVIDNESNIVNSAVIEYKSANHGWIEIPPIPLCHKYLTVKITIDYVPGMPHAERHLVLIKLVALKPENKRALVEYLVDDGTCACRMILDDMRAERLRKGVDANADIDFDEWFAPHVAKPEVTFK